MRRRIRMWIPTPINSYELWSFRLPHQIKYLDIVRPILFIKSSPLPSAILFSERSQHLFDEHTISRSGRFLLRKSYPCLIWLFYLWMLYIRGTLIDSWNIEFFLKLFFDRPAPSVVKSKAPVDLNDSYISSKSFNNLNVKCHLELIWNEINLWDFICFRFCCYCCNIYDLISRPTHSSTPSLSF